jgi:3-isopropylmalate/(R)-2-methylmalate dehydratase small subunit
VSGRIFLFGDNIDTDQLAPGQHMKGGIAELARHCLESVRPDFAQHVRLGDIIVAGRNFGLGSSREQAAEALKFLGVRVVVARSFAGIFYRNAINLGLPVMVAPTIEGLRDGASAEFDLSAAEIRVPADGLLIKLEPLPDNLQRMVGDGGLVAHLKKRLLAARA